MEYIERGAFLEEMQKHRPVFSSGLDGSKERLAYLTWHSCLNAIKTFPAADVREARHALWIEDDFTSLIKCSACGNDAPLDTTGGGQYKSRFCPSCGADMRAGVE